MPDKPLKKKKILKNPARYYILQEELDNLSIREVYPNLVKKIAVDPRELGKLELKNYIFTCSDDARLAGYIYAIAKSDLHRLEDEFDVKMGEWLLDTRADIAAMKEDKDWIGSVSKEDVNRIIAKEQEEYRSYMKRIRKAERTVMALKAFYDSWQHRLSSLQTFARLEFGRERGMDESTASSEKRSQE
ncbi:MAG: hypothetical protein KAS32_19915 [Candidatus Peribacteraceae bacterium]|nr:hypothetical protein [Candidatus Peribacteraceae bacterium]